MFKVLAKIAYAALILIEGLIAIRFVIILINANPNNSLISLALNISEIFVKPFYGVVNDTWKFSGITFDLTCLVSLMFYMIMAFICLELIKAFSQN
jgi:hypothetical protein